MPETDPVTGYEFSDSEVTEIDNGNNRVGTKFRHDSKWYYFRSLSERQKFIGNPEAFLGGGEDSDSND
ncbi:MAG: hypothetical protein OXC55_01850 [Chloroflexi bacterium]|nr:hypothetical protein [Chloroflexota bacterium]